MVVHRAAGPYIVLGGKPAGQRPTNPAVLQPTVGSLREELAMLSHAPLNRTQVETIMGRLDDLKLAEILETGASEPELLEAKRWVSGYKRTVPEDLPLRPSVVDRLCDIIRMDEPDWYEGEPS
jgi:hypothetical protein